MSMTSSHLQQQRNPTMMSVRHIAPRGGGGNPNEFFAKYKVIPMITKRPEHEDGGKIILPPSALGRIAHLNLEYPLLFKLTNPEFAQRVTHCGVLEFTAPEGNAFVPFWMMQNIQLKEFNFVHVHTRTLPRATFIKLQPQSESFLDISNPKAVLEKTLRKYSAMTIGDTILFKYNNKEYMLQVLEIKPDTLSKAVSIVEADVNVDFAPPPGYKEQIQEPLKKEEKVEKIVKKEELDPSQLEDSEESEEEKQPRFSAFSGAGARISGKSDNHPSILTPRSHIAKEEEKPILTTDGAVVYKPVSEIEALRKKRQEEYEQKAKEAKLKAEKNAKEEAEKKMQQQGGFVAFSGQGHRMR